MGHRKHTDVQIVDFESSPGSQIEVVQAIIEPSESSVSGPPSTLTCSSHMPDQGATER
jgi:hypothetical protein